MIIYRGLRRPPPMQAWYRKVDLYSGDQWTGLRPHENWRRLVHWILDNATTEAVWRIYCVVELLRPTGPLPNPQTFGGSMLLDPHYCAVGRGVGPIILPCRTTITPKFAMNLSLRLRLLYAHV